LSAESSKSDQLGSRSADSGAKRGLGVVVGVVVLGFKTFAYGRFLTSPGVAIWFLPLLAVLSLRRAKPITMSVSLALFVALLIHPHPLAAEAGLAVGSLVALVAVCVAIGLVLRWRDDRPAA
jgi:hypothetical protein